MKKHWLIPSICILLGLCIVVACMDDSLSPPTTNNKPTATEYLRRQFEEKHVSLPDCRLKEGKSSRSATDIDYDAMDFTIDWKHYQVFNNKENRIWIFPVAPSHPMSGHVYARSGATVKRRATPVTFKLMVRKLGKRGVSRLITYIPEPKYLRNRGNPKVEDLGWDLRGTNYSGLVLNSHLNGELVFGLKYESGRAVYRFALRRGTAGEVSPHGHTVSGAHLSFGFHSRKDTRASSYSDGENEVDYCAGCGRPEDMCTCYELTCSFCGQPVDNCTCWMVDPSPEPEPDPDWDIYCPTCGFVICQCCPNCHSYPCDCEPEGGDGTDTDEGEYEDTDQGGGGNPPSFDNTPLTPENFLDKIISILLKDKLESRNINYSHVRIIINAQVGKKAYMNYNATGSIITVFRLTFDRGLTRRDMESTIFHEFIHHDDKNKEEYKIVKDNDGFIINQPYEVYFTQYEMNNLNKDIEKAALEKGIPLSSRNPQQEKAWEELKQMYGYDYFYRSYNQEFKIPIQANINKIAGDVHAYSLQLEEYGNLMSDDYRKETEQKLEHYKDLLKQIKER